MKVIQVVPNIAYESSGVSYTLLSICKGLFNAGCEVELYSTGFPGETKFPFKTVECAFKKFPAARLRRSPDMYNRLLDVCRHADIIHNNSLWMMPNVYPYWAAKGKQIKVVTSPHGTMSKWALKRGWLKKTIFSCIQYPALSRTDMFHATCEKECREIRELGYKQPIAIIPIGVDVASASLARPCMRTKNGPRQLAFFGRLHQVKAVDNLVRAWGRVSCQFEDWELVIAGPDCGLRPMLESIIKKERIPRIRFVGELKGRAKYDFLANVNLCVLPSHTENFGVTVAESLACGTPVIASHGTPWKGLVDNDCGWWIPIGDAPLVAQLQKSLSMDDAALREMGERGRGWVRRDFDWNAIGRKMKETYEWLLDRAPKPEWVREV